MKRKMMALIGLLALLLPAGAALAGGWVVITVDDLPAAIRAGETVEISFVARAHGRTLTHELSPFLSAQNVATGERIEIAAEPAAELGRFTAIVAFPRAGEWTWSISAEPYPQLVTLAPLTVQPALLSSAPVPSPTLDMMLALRGAGLALLAAGAVLALLSWRRQPGDVVATGD